MARSLTTRNLFDKKYKRVMLIPDEDFSQAVGNATRSGCWLIYGSEKNGKTWFALQIAKILSKAEKVLYISAEEGLDKSFSDACKRAGITTKDRILWDEYMCIKDMVDKLKKQRSPNIIFIDNLTSYSDDIKPSELQKELLSKLPNKLIVFIAHEERKDAYPALARMAKKMSKVIVHVSGLSATVISRFGDGGTFAINEGKMRLIFGNKETKLI